MADEAERVRMAAESKASRRVSIMVKSLNKILAARTLPRRNPMSPYLLAQPR